MKITPPYPEILNFKRTRPETSMGNQRKVENLYFTLIKCNLCLYEKLAIIEPGKIICRKIKNLPNTKLM